MISRQDSRSSTPLKRAANYLKLLQECEQGLACVVGGQLKRIECRILFCTSDMPATKKLIGAAGHAHNAHPCNICDMDLAGINDPRGYEPENLQPKAPPSDLLRSIFESRETSDKARDGSYVKYGFRFGELLRCTGMDPALSSPVDPLHNSFLGLVGSFVNMIFANNLLTKDQAETFVRTFSEATYPGHLGRIPTRIGTQLTRKVGSKTNAVSRSRSQKGQQPIPTIVHNESTGPAVIVGDTVADLIPAATATAINGKKRMRQFNDGDQGEKEDDKTTKLGTGIKADTWKRIAQALPVALFNAWRVPDSDEIMVGDEYYSEIIVDIEESSEDKRSKQIIRNRRLWYQAALGLSAGLRVLHAHTIRYDDALMGVKTLAVVSKNLLALGARLTINWHIAMHYAE